TALNEEGHLRNFIDLALTTQDKKWFMQLTTSLKKLEQTGQDPKPIKRV
ncbi:hypothetical protein CEN49_26465, partial [Fischerella thermalis CCMEE 5273]